MGLENRNFYKGGVLKGFSANSVKKQFSSRRKRCTAHTSNLYSKSLASFLKYAGDAVIGHPCKDSQGIFTINNTLKYVSDWSALHLLTYVLPSPPKGLHMKIQDIAQPPWNESR